MYYELNREREREMISKELLGYYGNCMSLRAFENMAKVIESTRSFSSFVKKEGQSVGQSNSMHERIRRYALPRTRPSRIIDPHPMLIIKWRNKRVDHA